MLVEVLEFAWRLLLARGDVVVLVDVDMTLALELQHHLLRLLEVRGHGIVVGQLGLSLLEKVHLGLNVGLSCGSRFLGRLDLCPSAAALAADLEHVRRDSFGH